MKCTLQFESHKCELPFLYLSHYRWPGTRMVLDQPCELSLHWVDGTGRHRAFNYTPDFFLLSETEAVLVECKPEDKLLSLTDAAQPGNQAWRYVKGTDGKWRSPPAEEAAAKVGLGFRVFSTAEISATLLNNLVFLQDYFDSKRPLGVVAARIQSLVASKPGLQLREIVTELKLPNEDIDELYTLIAREIVCVDLDQEPIAPNWTARVFPSADHLKAWRLLPTGVHRGRTPVVTEVALEPGTIVNIGAHDSTIVAVDDNAVILATGGGTTRILRSQLEHDLVSGRAIAKSNGPSAPCATVEAQELLRQVTTAEWQRALVAHKRIDKYLSAPTRAERKLLPRPDRTQARLLSRFKSAKNIYGIGLLGLVGKSRSGNRTPRLDPRAQAIVDAVVDTCYMSKIAPSIEFVWGECSRRCEEHLPQLPAPSRPTIRKAILKRGVEKVVASREGPRAAYNHACPIWSDDWDGVSIEGDYAWASAHIDHTQLDLTTSKTGDGLKLGRPWLTLMVSAKHRRVLAFALSFEEPSYRSCMAVIRDCVHRHHRLPRVIVVDNGSEFSSIYFESLLARFNITKKSRPPARAKFGSVLERLNGTLNTKLLHNLPGNTKLSKRVRVLTADFQPEAHAVWQLPEIYEILEEFLMDWLDTQPLDVLNGLSPRASFLREFRWGGPRESRIILPTEEFQILTLPTTKKGTGTVRRQEGVVVNSVPYWCAAFRDPASDGKSVPVRFDPHDLSTIFIELDGKWHRCKCRQFEKTFVGLTEKEIRAASVELLAGAQTAAEKRRAISARSLAAFFQRRGVTPDLKRMRGRAEQNEAARALRSAADTADKSDAQVAVTCDIHADSTDTRRVPEPTVSKLGKGFNTPRKKKYNVRIDD